MGNSASKNQESLKNSSSSSSTRMSNKAHDSKKGQTRTKKINDLSMPIFLRRPVKTVDQSGPIFPAGVILEILTRLPLKSVTHFQLVCKDWQALILDHYFTEKHLDHSDFTHHWHNNSVSSSNWQNKPDYISLTYLHGCNGLLLMRNNNEKKHFLWNPATRRVLELPDPHHDSHGFAFSFVPSTKSYRIVSVYKDDVSGVEGCEVFTPSDQSEVWRPLKFPEIKNNSSFCERVSVVLCGGAVHCVFVTKLYRETKIDIVSLDLETEEFFVNHFPKKLRHDDQFGEWKNYWDMDCDGKLGIADIVGKNLEVMELEDYKKQRWCEKKKVIHLVFLEKEIKDVDEVFPLFVRKGEIWFWLKDEKIFTYTIATGNRIDRRKASTLSLSSKVYPYKPSLISLQGMVPEPDTKLETYRPRFK